MRVDISAPPRRKEVRSSSDVDRPPEGSQFLCLDRIKGRAGLLLAGRGSHFARANLRIIECPKLGIAAAAVLSSDCGLPVQSILPPLPRLHDAARDRAVSGAE
jgi:hypothetical protein